MGVADQLHAWQVNTWVNAVPYGALAHMKRTAEELQLLDERANKYLS